MQREAQRRGEDGIEGNELVFRTVDGETGSRFRVWNPEGQTVDLTGADIYTLQGFQFSNVNMGWLRTLSGGSLNMAQSYFEDVTMPLSYLAHAEGVRFNPARPIHAVTADGSTQDMQRLIFSSPEASSATVWISNRSAAQGDYEEANLQLLHLPTPLREALSTVLVEEGRGWANFKGDIFVDVDNNPFYNSYVVAHEATHAWHLHASGDAVGVANQLKSAFQADMLNKHLSQEEYNQLLSQFSLDNPEHFASIEAQQVTSMHPQSWNGYDMVNDNRVFSERMDQLGITDYGTKAWVATMFWYIANEERTINRGGQAPEFVANVGDIKYYTGPIQSEAVSYGNIKNSFPTTFNTALPPADS